MSTTDPTPPPAIDRDAVYRAIDATRRAREQAGFLDAHHQDGTLDQALARSLGERLVRSDTFAERARANPDMRGRWSVEQLMTGAELSARLAAASPLRARSAGDYAMFPDDPRVFTTASAAPALLPSLVEMTPVTGFGVLIVEEIDSLDAGGVPALVGEPGAGAPLPATDMTLSRARAPLARWGSWTSAPKSWADDPGGAIAVVNAMLERAFLRGLERDLLVGDGQLDPTTGITHLLGVLNAGVTTIPRTDGTAVDTTTGALIRGAQQVLAAGHFGPLTILAGPDVLETFAREIALGVTVAGTTYQPVKAAQALSAVGVAWPPVPTNRLPAGTAIVGDWRAAIQVFISEQGLAFEETSGFMDFFARGLLALSLSTELTSWLRQPTALNIVTGASA